MFAPVYRQVTLTALRAGKMAAADWGLAYADVKAAFANYLARDNGGRPFVLIGHSQGSLLLKRLVAEEIDGTPLSQRMLSAILPGTAVLVPRGKDVGGDFKALPLCRAPSADRLHRHLGELPRRRPGRRRTACSGGTARRGQRPRRRVHQPRRARRRQRAAGRRPRLSVVGPRASSSTARPRLDRPTRFARVAGI